MNNEERAASYRKLAAEARADAEGSVEAHVREGFETVARDYDRMADTVSPKIRTVP